ncbi:MAG: putative glycoside hydrolase [bacterium]|nr:putative glycoside hydrolase [bacterium]
MVIIIAVAAAGVIFYNWQITLVAQNQAMANGGIVTRQPKIERIKTPRITAKGIYLTAYSAGSRKKMDGIIKLLEDTELNSVVIDVKDYSGKIFYDSKISFVKKIGAVDNRIGDVQSLIRSLHEKNIYVIARQTVFQDPLLAQKKPEWAIKDKTGGLWRDHKGLNWVDPTREEVWNYNLSIAKEAIELGFDEINFDYMRFPSDGDMSRVVYTNGLQSRHEVMREFYAFLSDGMKDEPVWTSIDMFGLVMEAVSGSDLNIGQRVEDAAPNFDYVCPMMYPSHYPSGHLGFKQPAEHPAEVITFGMTTGAPFFYGTRAKVRPWLQAFNIGAVYDSGEKIRAQIDAAEANGADGWLLWNAANRYSASGLKP